MPLFDSPSRCSGGTSIQFRWYGFPACSNGDDVSSAVSVLMTAVKGGTRVWNPYAEQMAKSEFKNRIKKAARGELKPVDEVKPVDVRNPPPLYEIRWIDLPVTDRTASGTLSHSTVQVRMYHSEPATVPGHFVGHHAHEKLVNVADVNATQQVEIKTAIGFYAAGASSNWGIAP